MKHLETFEGLFNRAKLANTLQVGNTYVYNQEGIGPLEVRYLGKRAGRKDVSFKINSEIGDWLSDRPLYVFEWLEGDNSISSWGVKGDKVALGAKEIEKNLTI